MLRQSPNVSQELLCRIGRAKKHAQRALWKLSQDQGKLALPEPVGQLSALLQEKEAEAQFPRQHQPNKAKVDQHRACPSKNGYLRELLSNFERVVLLMARQQAQRQSKLAHSQAQVAGQGLAAHSEAQRAGQAQGASQAGTLPSSLEELPASLEELSALLPSVASDQAVSVLFSWCQA